MTASWIIREKGSRRVVCETFNKKTVDALNTARYEAVPVLDYLYELNAEIKRQNARKPTWPA